MHSCLYRQVASSLKMLPIFLLRKTYPKMTPDFCMSSPLSPFWKISEWLLYRSNKGYFYSFFFLLLFSFNSSFVVAVLLLFYSSKGKQQSSPENLKICFIFTGRNKGKQILTMLKLDLRKIA